MKVTTEKIDQCQAVMNIELEPAEVEKGIEGAYRRLVGRVKVPGFRPGKAPRAVLERQIGPEALLEEALEQLIPDAYDEALKQESLESVGRPKLELLETSPVKLKAIVPLKPIVKLGNYRDELRLQPESPQVTDEEIERTVRLFANQKATLIPVERAGAYGDVLTVDIVGKLQGEEFLDRKGSQCEILEKAVAPLPGFAEKLLGAAKGEVREFDLSFPADYSDKALAGKDYSFKVTVNEVKEKKMPELNDEFAKEMGADTFVEWKERIVETLKRRAEEKARRDYENKIIDGLVKLADIQYPPGIVEAEIDHTIDEEARNFKGGLKDIENYLKSVGRTMEQHRDELRDGATERVLRSLALEQLAADEKVEAKDEEVDAEISKLAESEGDRAEQMKQYWNQPQARHSIEHFIINRKTLARLAEIAQGGAQGTGGGKE